MSFFKSVDSEKKMIKLMSLFHFQLTSLILKLIKKKI